jgi:hypothetical protein
MNKTELLEMLKEHVRPSLFVVSDDDGREHLRVALNWVVDAHEIVAIDWDQVSVRELRP